MNRMCFNAIFWMVLASILCCQAAETTQEDALSGVTAPEWRCDSNGQKCVFNWPFGSNPQVDAICGTESLFCLKNCDIGADACAGSGFTGAYCNQAKNDCRSACFQTVTQCVAKPPNRLIEQSCENRWPCPIVDVAPNSESKYKRCVFPCFDLAINQASVECAAACKNAHDVCTLTSLSNCECEYDFNAGYSLCPQGYHPPTGHDGDAESDSCTQRGCHRECNLASDFALQFPCIKDPPQVCANLINSKAPLSLASTPEDQLKLANALSSTRINRTEQYPDGWRIISENCVISRTTQGSVEFRAELTNGHTLKSETISDPILCSYNGGGPSKVYTCRN